MIDTFNLRDDITFRLSGRSVLATCNNTTEIIRLESILSMPHNGTFTEISSMPPSRIMFSGSVTRLNPTLKRLQYYKVTNACTLAQLGILSIAQGYRDGLVGAVAVTPLAVRQFKYGYQGSKTHRCLNTMDFIPDAIKNSLKLQTIVNSLSSSIKNTELSIDDQYILKNSSLTELYRTYADKPNTRIYKILKLMEASYTLRGLMDTAQSEYALHILLANQLNIPNRSLTEARTILNTDPTKLSIALNPNEILVRGPWSAKNKASLYLRVMNTYPISLVNSETGSERKYKWLTQSKESK